MLHGVPDMAQKPEIMPQERPWHGGVAAWPMGSWAPYSNCWQLRFVACSVPAAAFCKSQCGEPNPDLLKSYELRSIYLVSEKDMDPNKDFSRAHNMIPK